MNRKELARIVEEQFDEWLPMPRSHLTNEEFDKRSTFRWALSEVIHVLEETDDPQRALINLVRRWQLYSTVDPKTRKMFRRARKVAAEALELVICLTE